MVSENQEITQLPVIKINVEGMELKTLVDTGSSISLIGMETYKRIQRFQKTKCFASGVTIRTINGSLVKFAYCTEIKIKIGKCNFKQTFFVTYDKLSDNYEVLLGFDLFKRHRVLLNTQDNTFTIEDSIIKINDDNEQQMESGVALNKKYILEPGQTSVLEVVSKNKNLNNSNKVQFYPGIFKQSIEVIPSINALEQNMTQILVQNKGDTKVHLNKKTRMGFLSTKISDPEESTDGGEQGKIEEINLIRATTEILRLRELEFSLENFELTHLEPTQKKQMEDTLKKYSMVFSESLKTLGHCDVIKPALEFYHDSPTACKPFQIPFSLRNEARRVINELLDANIIKPSYSNWVAPVLLVKKGPHGSEQNGPNKEKKFRFILDLRLLNSCLKKLPQNLPDIKDTIASLSGFKYFTTLDLKQAFWQIDFKEYSDKVGFATSQGVHQFSRLPYGLKNASTIFQSVMDLVLDGLQKKGIRCFVDDVIIPANDFSEMKEKVILVFERLKEHNLTLQSAKCKFFLKKITYLGFEISDQGITPIKSNVDKILSFPRPRNMKELKKFCGLTNFYRETIKDYAKYTQVLEKLIQKDVKFIWNEEHENAFQGLQRQFFERPFLIQMRAGDPLILNTDASATGIAGVLMQKRQGHLRAIAYYSKKLTKVQSKLPAIEIELIAIYQSVLYFNRYLIGSSFTILTDHEPLRFFRRMKNNSNRINKMLRELSEYSFTVQHIKGKDNVLSDFISRIPHQDQPSVEFETDLTFAKTIATQGEINTMETMDKIDSFRENGETSASGNELNERHILDLQLLDEVNINLRNALKKDNKGKLKEKYRNFFIDKKTNLLKYKNRFRYKGNYQEFDAIVLPEKLHKTAVLQGHYTHMGVQKVFRTLRERFYWKTMLSDIKNFVASCEWCLRLKRNHQKILPGGMANIPNEVGCRISTDILGPIDSNYVLTILDNYSRHLELYRLKRIDARSVAECLMKYITSYGVPQSIFSDNGGPYISNAFKILNEQLGIRLIHIPSLTPHMNGMSESINSEIKHTILALKEQNKDLDFILAVHKSFYNSTIHETTGYSPNEIFFARKIPPLIDKVKNKHTAEEMLSYPNYIANMFDRMSLVKKLATENIHRQHVRQHEYAARKSAKRAPLRVNDTVYLQGNSKFSKKFTGPYTVIKVISQNLVQIQENADPLRIRIAHICKLKQSAKRLPKFRSEVIEKVNTPIKNSYFLRSRMAM